MAELLKFRTPDRQRIMDEAHTADYQNAEDFKKVRVGKLGVYHRDLWRRMFVPYESITRAYRGVSVVMPDDHPAIEYFRLILKNSGREIANVIFGEHDEELVDRLVLRIGELSPATAIGYEEPPKPEKRKK